MNDFVQERGPLSESGKPPALGLPAKVATNCESLRFVAFNLNGLQVRGTHDSETAPVLEILHADFAGRHRDWRAKILAKPGGFDGHRAVLLSFRVSGGDLQIHTGYRTYTEGRALHDTLFAARASGQFELAPSDLLRPRACLSWGASLATFVLLPHEHVLCSQRALTLAVNPGVWTCSFTEVLEPSDIDWRSMDALLSRLEAEELPALAGLGHSKFVGLGVQPLSYTWQLVGVLDLRDVAFESLVAALTALKPDSETAAWAVHSLRPTALDERPYPLNLYNAETVTSSHAMTAEFLSRSVARVEH